MLSKPRATTISHLGIIVALALLTLVVINPFRNVLLGDDSIYVRSVQRLAEGGEFKLGPGTTPTMIFPVFWGWLFTIPFGFSISAVVFSVVPLALIGLVAFYATILEFDNSKSVALFGTLAVLTSPLYTRLLASFMSDVPFLSLMFLTIFFYVKGLKSGSSKLLFLGSITLSLSVLTRQTGIAFAVAIAMALVYQIVSKHRFSWSNITAGLALPLLTIIGYELWLHGLNGETWAQRYVVREPMKRYVWQWSFPLKFIDSLFRYALFNLLLALPFLTMSPKTVFASMKLIVRRPFIVAGIILMIVCLDVALTTRGTPMFWLPGVLYWMGLRVLLSYWGPVSVLLILFMVAIYGGKSMALLTTFRSAGSDAPMFLLVSTVLILLLATSLLPADHSNDRYLLPVFPLTGLILLGRSNQRTSKAIPICLMALSLLWGVWATRFSYDIAAVQWGEANRLAAAGVKKEDIRGSWAWEGWNFWDDCLDQVARNGGTAESENDCWGSQTQTPYRIKLHRIMGYRVDSSIEGYQIEKVIAVRTFGVPAEVTVTTRHDHK
jgi:hypothetical protein